MRWRRCCRCWRIGRRCLRCLEREGKGTGNVCVWRKQGDGQWEEGTGSGQCRSPCLPAGRPWCVVRKRALERARHYNHRERESKSEPHTEQLQ